MLRVVKECLLSLQVSMKVGPEVGYAFFYSLALVVALHCSVYSFRRLSYGTRSVVLFHIYVIAGGIVGAHLCGYALKATGFAHATANSTMLGAICVGIPTVFLSSRLLGISSVKALAIVATFVPLAMSLARLGCFVRGCCDGMLFGFSVTLISSVLDFVLFLILLEILKQRGATLLQFIVFLIVYGCKRLILDNFRSEVSPTLWGLSAYQLLGAAMLLGGLSILAWRRSEGWKRDASAVSSNSASL